MRCGTCADQFCVGSDIVETGSDAATENFLVSSCPLCQVCQVLFDRVVKGRAVRVLDGNDISWLSIAVNQRCARERPVDRDAQRINDGRQYVNEGSRSTDPVSLDLLRQFDKQRDCGNITGTVAGDTPLDLAFSVNGIIRATGRTYDIEGFEDQFAVLLPPEALIGGENIVQVYQLDSSAGELHLVALQQADLPVYRMATRGRQRLIIDANGKQFTVQSGMTTGAVLSIEDEGAALHKLQGSVPTGATAIPRIVVFKDGQFAGSSNAVNGVFNIPLRSGTPCSARPWRRWWRRCTRLRRSHAQ